MRGVAWLLAAFAAGPAAAAPDIDAIVSHETRQVLASGVTRVDTWQERFVRRGDEVWSERVLSKATGAAHAHESGGEHIGHRHFNGDTSARWLRRLPSGELELRFVDREHQAVVDVPKAEFGTVGFDGRFDGAASIVPPAAVREMKAAAGGWRVDRSDGWSHRVMWSAARRLAMKVESRRDDGSLRRVVSVRLVPPAPPPWQALGGYAQKRYDDFMD
jgi:hypothetical protein